MWSRIKRVLAGLFYVAIFISSLSAVAKLFGIDGSVFDPYVSVIFKIFLVILGAVVLLSAFIAYRVKRTNRHYAELRSRQLARIDEIRRAIESGAELSAEDILPFASRPETRQLTWHFLHEHGLLDLFPEEFNNIKDAAESYLVNWLENPNELGTIPDEVKHLERIDVSKLTYYHVFGFRVDSPHWAAERGWMIGVVGPYEPESSPYADPYATFSRLNRLDETSISDEVAWVEEFTGAGRYDRD